MSVTMACHLPVLGLISAQEGGALLVLHFLLFFCLLLFGCALPAGARRKVLPRDFLAPNPRRWPCPSAPAYCPPFLEVCPLGPLVAPLRFWIALVPLLMGIG